MLSPAQQHEMVRLRSNPKEGGVSRDRENIRKQLERRGLIFFDREQWLWCIARPQREVHMREIFVFGSNLGGYHGAGAARYAIRAKGAILHQAHGLQGESYAIPTKDEKIRFTLPLEEIQEYVDRFKEFARQHPNLSFQVTRIGCGLAGLKDPLVAAMFKGAPMNCRFDTEWEPYLGAEYDYWGTF